MSRDGRVIADRMRKVADILEKYDNIPVIRDNEPMEEEMQPGAALMLMFLRDLFTIAGKETFTRDEILVLLNSVQNDRELFTLDLVTLMDEEETVEG